MLKHNKVEPYCVLCHHVLPLREPNQLDADAETEGDAGNWWSNVVCFYTDEKKQLRLLRQDLRDWSNQLRVMNGHHIPQGRYFCSNVWSNCAKCDVEDTLNFVHVSCLQRARKSCQGFTVDDLGRIAQMHRPIVGWLDTLRLLKARLTPYTIFKDYAVTTELGGLISDIERRLPIELQIAIYNNLSGLSRSILDCSTAVLAYNLDRKNQSKRGPSRARLSVDDIVARGTIGANYVKIFGETCLEGVSTDNRKFADEITIADKSIHSMQVSLGTYGVVGLRFWYQDGTASDWLGQQTGNWSTLYSARGRRQLQVTSDGFKVLRVGFASMEQSSYPRFTDPVQMFWNYHPKNTGTTRHSLIDLTGPNPQVRGNSEARLAQYLDLRNVNVRYFTVFCNSNGARGIQINGDATRMLGYSAGCVAITHYLNKEESIRSIFIVTLGTAPHVVRGPQLLIMTSRGRTLYFGPLNLLYFRAAKFSDFGIRPTEQVSGIFIDPTTASSRNLNSIGVTLEQQNPLLEQNADSISVPSSEGLEQAAFLTRHTNEAFVSKARLTNIRRLYLQLSSSACKGLRIDHEDDTLETLGQWDPSDATATRLLYESSDGPLLGLWFEYSEGMDPMARQIKRLEAVLESGTHKPSESGFLWENLDSDLAWWFTDSYAYVEKWTEVPKVLDIPPVPAIPSVTVGGLSRDVHKETTA